ARFLQPVTERGHGLQAGEARVQRVDGGAEPGRRPRGPTVRAWRSRAGTVCSRKPSVRPKGGESGAPSGFGGREGGRMASMVVPRAVPGAPTRGIRVSSFGPPRPKTERPGVRGGREG